MATRTIATFVDDLDGSEAVECVSFGLDGVTYEIDLSSSNSTRLHTALEEFVNGGRRVAGRRKPPQTLDPENPAQVPSANGTGSTGNGSNGGRSRRSSDERAQQIREWARGEGMDVRERGKLPQNVIDAYDAAH